MLGHLQMTIRKLQKEDWAAVRQILEHVGTFSSYEIQVANELIDFTLEDPEQKDYEIYVGVGESKEILGYLCLGPTPTCQGTFDLYWIAVKKSEQNVGVGRQLLDYLVNLVKSRGARLLVAETSSQPRYEKARKFYQVNGFQVLARIREYYAVGDDLIIYGKYFR
jgi:ribosomal protein S18 acetylase RimI-like enzyme